MKAARKLRHRSRGVDVTSAAVIVRRELPSDVPLVAVVHADAFRRPDAPAEAFRYAPPFEELP